MDRIPWWRLKLTVVVLVDQGGQRQQRWAAWLGLIRSTQQRRRRQGAAHALTFAVNRLPSTKAPNLSKAVKYSGDIYGGDRHFWLIQIWGSQNTGRCSHRACMRGDFPARTFFEILPPCLKIQTPKSQIAIFEQKTPFF